MYVRLYQLHKRSGSYCDICVRILLHVCPHIYALACAQIDNGIENTGNRKLLRIVPIILFMASYRQTAGQPRPLHTLHY